MNALELIGFIVQDAFWSAIAATGFAVLFNVPMRTLPACALAGAMGHGLRTLLQQFGVSIEMATLISATVIGFLGVISARFYKTPATIFTVSGSIPLVPGALAYRTMIGILQFAHASSQTADALLVTLAQNGIQTALILGAIAVGIAAPKLLFFRQKPVV